MIVHGAFDLGHAARGKFLADLLREVEQGSGTGLRCFRMLKEPCLEAKNRWAVAVLVLMYCFVHIDNKIALDFGKRGVNACPVGRRKLTLQKENTTKSGGARTGLSLLIIL